MLNKTILALIFVALACAASPVAAQGRNSARRPGSQYGRIYDPRTVETVAGEIVRVEKLVSMRGPHRGVHWLLKTSQSEPLAVHLGPDWFVDKQEIAFKEGDRVEVRGSRVTFEGKAAIIAAEVTKDGKTLHLRDANGVPAWAGWSGRGRRF
jgi:hypothetical protein